MGEGTCLALKSPSTGRGVPARLLAVCNLKQIPAAVSIFSHVGSLKGSNRKKGLRGCGGFWQDMALAMLPIFILVKPKRVRKMAVPLGLIWWSHLKRHPLNKEAGRLVYRFRTDPGVMVRDASRAGFAKAEAELPHSKKVFFWEDG